MPLKYMYLCDNVSDVVFLPVSTGYMGKPVLLPVWLPVLGVHYSGDIRVTDSCCYGLLPVVWRGESGLIQLCILNKTVKCTITIFSCITITKVCHVSVSVRCSFVCDCEIEQ